MSRLIRHASRVSISHNSRTCRAAPTKIKENTHKAIRKAEPAKASQSQAKWQQQKPVQTRPKRDAVGKALSAIARDLQHVASNGHDYGQGRNVRTVLGTQAILLVTINLCSCVPLGI